MTAREYFDSISTTDASKMVIDKTRSKFSLLDLIRFAEAYHLAKIKTPSTILGVVVDGEEGEEIFYKINRI